MTAALLRLRQYQREAIDAVDAAHDGGMKRPAVVLPTGAGKTVVFSHQASEHLAARDGRVLVLVHRDELADQALGKLADVAPHLRLGKVKARDDATGAQVVVGSVQTLARPERMARLVASQRRHGPFGLAITDECHHAAALSYQGIYRSLPPELLHSGYTATMARGDGVGLGSTWDDVVYSRSILRMIADGYLVDVRGQSVELDDLDLRRVKRSGGDYSAGSLGEALEEAHGPELIAAAVLKHARDRRPIVFTPTVATAHATAKELEARGIPCGVVSGETPRDERLDVYARFRDERHPRHIRAMVNCAVLTEGADFPMCDAAVIARPTRNAGLFVQMVGRALRPYPGKTDALVLDVAGTGGTLSTLVDLAPGEVTAVMPGETLAEAVEREKAELEEARRDEPRKGDPFKLRNKSMDLFRATSVAWLRTAGGVLFIPCGGADVLVWPSQRNPGTWGVWIARGPAQSWQQLKADLPFGTAQAWAETLAQEAGARVDTEASWRRRQATPGQIRRARSMRVDVVQGDPAGKVSDAMAVLEATEKYDRFLPR